MIDLPCISSHSHEHDLVPIVRPQDNAKKGKGTIRITHAEGPEALSIIGLGTHFTTQISPKDSIVLAGKRTRGESVEVIQVISDTELLVKTPFTSVDELLSEKGCLYKCMPHVEQSTVYKCVHDELNKNGCIAIFPEGGSHDRTEMLPFKGKEWCLIPIF